MKEIRTGAYTHINKDVDEVYNFDFCTDLSSADKLKFVNSVVSILVDENNYNSIIRDLIFDYYIIKIFTTVDTKKLDKSPTFLNDVEQFLDETNIVEIVKANAFPTLFDELNKAIDLNIQYLTGIHPSPIADSIASLLSTIEKKINEVDLDGMMEMAKTFAGMTGEITPESIVNAYITSDVHKKNLSEIEEFKKKQQE